MTASSAPHSEPVHRGSCMCGDVRVALTGAPTDVTLCHCTTCQKNGGTAFMVAIGAHRHQLELDDGAGSLRYWRSGPETQRSFCSRCGTPVGFHFDNPERDRITVWFGLFDETSDLRPTGQIWTDSRPEWVCRIEGLRASPKGATLP